MNKGTESLGFGTTEGMVPALPEVPAIGDLEVTPTLPDIPENLAGAPSADLKKHRCDDAPHLSLVQVQSVDVDDGM